MQRKVTPIQAVAVALVVIVVVAFVAWKLTFGKAPRKLERIPKRAFGPPQGGIGSQQAPTGAPPAQQSPGKAPPG